MGPDRLSSVEPLYGCARNNFASSLTLGCHKTFRHVWHRGFRAPQTTNGRFAPIVLKKSAAQLFGCCRESGARELGCFQAGIGTGNGMSFANFRRFWTMAASRNSS